MKKPLLSIVLITQEDTSLAFKKALGSALAQTYEKKEIFVVNGNDHNSPFSLGLLEDLLSHPEVKLIQPEQTGNNSFYRNIALQRVRGQYVGFMMGKDVWLPEKASLQIGQLQEEKEAAVSIANGIVNYSEPKFLTGMKLFSEITFDTRRWLLEQPVRKCSQIIYRTDLLRRQGGFDENFDTLADLDLLISWRENYLLLFFPAILFATEEATDKKNFLCCFEDRQVMLKKHADLFIVTPRLSFAYSTSMGKQALNKGLWFHAGTSFFLAFLNAPLLFGINLVRFFARGSWQCLRRAGLSGAAFLKESRLRAGKRHLKTLNCGTQKPKETVKTGIENSFMEKNTTAESFANFPAFHFAKRKGGREITIPERVRIIRKGMFFGCPLLESITIPATVTRIEAHAFQNCPRLTNIRFLPGSKLSAIGNYAFAGCRTLEELHLPGGLTSLGKGAFFACEQLTHLTFNGHFFPSATYTLPPYLFAGCLSLEKVIFEEGSMLEQIGKGAFLHCQSLNTILVTGAIKSIGAFAFFGCNNLKHFGMPLLDAVESIGSHAFSGCSRLPEIQVPYSLKLINRRTYYGCKEVKSVIIPGAVRTIKRQAFARCSSLEEVLLMNKLTYYASSAFPKKTAVTVYKT